MERFGSLKSWKITRIFRTLLVLSVILLSSHAQNTKRINQKTLKPSDERKRSDEQEIQYFIETLKNETKDKAGYEEIVYYDEPGVVPELPKIKLFDEESLEVGKELTAGCVSRYGDPPAEIFWFIDRQPLPSVLEFEEADDVRTVSSVISVLRRNLTVDDDGKSLVCQAWHPGYPNKYAEVKYKLFLNFKPVAEPTQIISGLTIGDSVDLSVSFRSHPKPSSLIWLIGDRKIYYGARTDKYVSREITTLGKNFWNASLHLTNLTHEDMTLNYKLQVRNVLGGTEYQIRLGVSDHEATTIAMDNEVGATEVELESTTIEDEEESTTVENTSLTQEESELTIKVKSSFVEESSVETTTQIDEYETEASTVDFEEFTTILDNNLPTEVPSSLTTLPATKENLTNTRLLRTRVSRVMIFKRLLSTKAHETTTESMVTIIRAKEIENDFNLKLTFIAIASNAITFWKTTLLIVLVIILIVSLSYYRKRIVRLKAVIVQKNLGSCYNQSCSYPQSSNAYTPTYFYRRNEKISGQLDSIYSDDGSSSQSRSIFYSHTYNPSHHSYESIDGESNEHIYAEIPWRKESDLSVVEGKPNNYENNPVTNYVDYDHLDYSQPLATNIPHHYHALLIRGNEPHQMGATSHEIESTYI